MGEWVDSSDVVSCNVEPGGFVGHMLVLPFPETRAGLAGQYIAIPNGFILRLS